MILYHSPKSHEFQLDLTEVFSHFLLSHHDLAAYSTLHRVKIYADGSPFCNRIE